MSSNKHKGLKKFIWPDKDNKNNMGLGVVVKDGDVNKALNILKYKCKKFDLYNEIKKHLEYTKPSDVRREEKKKGLKLHKRIERQKRNEEKL